VDDLAIPELSDEEWEAGESGLRELRLEKRARTGTVAVDPDAEGATVTGAGGFLAREVLLGRRSESPSHQ
jgi:hypothetical protein